MKADQKQSISCKYLFDFFYKKVGENHVWQGLSNFFVLYLDSSGQFKNRQIATLELLIKVKYRPCKFWTFSEENLLVA